MKLKKLLVTICAVAIAMSSFAQLSTRSDDPSTFKFGTRPVAGDMGLNFQFYNATTNPSFYKYFNKMPIINMQYYLDSDLALRFGIRASKDKTLYKGEADSAGIYYTLLDGNYIKTYKDKSSTREYMIYLGLEKHYSPTNILDVYWGGQIPLGFSSTVNETNMEYLIANNVTVTDNQITRRNTIIYGIEAFFGLQAFIADLPFAVGVEWGIAGYGRLKNKTYHKEEISGNPTKEYYTNPNLNNGGSTNQTEFTKLNSRTFDMDDMWRFRISYYFSK